VPDLVRALALHVAEPESSPEERTSAAAMAAGLGKLRQRQGASLHQLLREFELLGEVLHHWLASRPALHPGETASAWLEVSRRMHEAFASWMRLSADTFAHHYAETLQRERNEVEVLLRTVDHEVRTPMGTIANVVALLEGDEDGEGTAAIVRRSLEQMTKTLGLLRRDVWRPAAEASVAVQECDLRSLVEDVLGRLRDLSAARGVELRMRGRFDSLGVDVGTLDLALVNLVSNAIKYARSDARPRIVEIVGEMADEQAILEVRDNGIGIPAEARQEIFERGVRAHRHADRQLGVRGDGLGLYLVQACVESLGGSVEVESEVGVGSCFRLRVPRRERA
jgi:signal transduction histidine kinase